MPLHLRFVFKWINKVDNNFPIDYMYFITKIEWSRGDFSEHLTCIVGWTLWKTRKMIHKICFNLKIIFKCIFIIVVIRFYLTFYVILSN